MALDTEKKNAIKGRLALILTTLIWGTSFVVLKNTLDVMPTLYVLAFRFSGAAILMFFIGFKHLKKLDSGYFIGGAVLGVFLFIAYALQTFGLNFTTPGKNAFLTTTYCVIVPFLYWAYMKKRPDGYNISAAVICLIGVGFVSLQADFSVNIGDLLTLACGLFYALHIVMTGKYVEGRSVVLLTMIQFAVAGALAWIFALLTDPFPTNISLNVVWSIAYMSIMCTAVCFVLQTYGQKTTPPSSVAVIMTLESVFGVIISIIFYGEILNLQLVVGFVLIFAAVLISETKPSFLRRTKSAEPVTECISDTGKM
ncbi:MAG: DMT family transporter [Oscillospiraceae bacterium]